MELTISPTLVVKIWIIQGFQYIYGAKAIIRIHNPPAPPVAVTCVPTRWGVPPVIVQ